MNKTLLISIFLLAFGSLACTITVPVPTINPGETHTFNVNEPLGGGDGPTQIQLQMNAGVLHLKGESSNAVTGTIQYNIPEWTPQLTQSDNEVTIHQKPEISLQIPSDKIINTWDLAIGQNPVELSIFANAYAGEMNLSGIGLRKLDIKDSAGSNKLVFTEYNPEILETFTYTTSASAAELRGLGFANFSEMKFDASAGAYTLDFTGQLQRPAEVIITGVGCNVRIVIPEGSASIIENRGTAAGIDIINGKWDVDQNIYRTEGNSPLLHIKVEITAGRLELVQQSES